MSKLRLPKKFSPILAWDERYLHTSEEVISRQYQQIEKNNIKKMLAHYSSAKFFKSELTIEICIEFFRFWRKYVNVKKRTDNYVRHYLNEIIIALIRYNKQPNKITRKGAVEIILKSENEFSSFSVKKITETYEHILLFLHSELITK